MSEAMVVEDFRAHQRQRGNGKMPLHVIDAGDWIGHAPKPRLFLDGSSRLVPMRNVTLLGGDGGTGKSLLALQLALACCTAIPSWIGMQVTPGPVLYLSAEDDEAEIHRRVVEIVEAEDGDLDAIRGRLHILDMVGEDATLAAERGRTGVIEPTELYRRVDTLLGDLQPILFVADNLADVYAGNENNRSAAKHFIGYLRHLALRHDNATLLLGHPSLTGLSSGSGASGSTAWSNSVRSRLYLKRLDDGADEDARVLETKKANYGRTGGLIGLRWHLNRFVRREVPKAADRMTMDTQDVVRIEADTQLWRADAKSDQWFGYWLADHLQIDVGQGVAGAERTPTQKTARLEILNLLKQFENGGVIHKVMKADSHRELRPFYAGGRAQ